MFNLSRRAFRSALSAVCAIMALSASAYAATSAPYQLLTQLKNPIVWQPFGVWLMMTEDLPAGRTCYFLNYTNKSKVILKQPQPGTWAPLGSAIKWLMYMDHVNGLDRLMAHDVDHQVYYVSKSSSMNQVGCGFVGNDCVFGQYRAAWVTDHYPVDIYRLGLWTGGTYTPMCISDSDKCEFAHDGNLMVYRAHYGPGDDRICGLYFSGGDEFTIANRYGSHPTVCGSLVCWAEPNGAGYNIVVKDVSTGEIRTVAYTTVTPPLPEAGSGAVFWETRNTTTGLDIYGYDWGSKRTFIVTNAAGDQVRLRVCGDLVTYVSGPRNYETLWAAKIERLIRRSVP